MAPSNGSCLCGSTKVSYDAEPAMKALCHCVDCRKISGSNYSTNMVVPGDTLKITGSKKEYKKKADSGSEIISYFCSDCGCTLVRTSESFPGMAIIKVGCLDDAGALNNAKPDAELFAPLRTSWVPSVQGAEDKQGMS